MKTQDLKNIIEVNLEIAKSQLKMSEGCLMRHNRVVVWEDTLLHVASNEGKPVVSSKVIATQFTEEMAAKICKEVANGAGKYPTAIGVIEYYKRFINQCEESLKELN
jgi:hypothetical protein